MGGIKNKLSKLTSKVKSLLSSLSLTERADGRSPSGEVTKAEGFCFSKSNPQSSCGRQLPLRKGAQDLLWDQRRQMKSDRISIGGFDRLVRITKYTSITCLTLAILSTLVLNIISSYSNSSTRSNAEPVSNSSTSTLANNNDSSTCDPNNINAESCISLSITSSSSSTSTGGDLLLHLLPLRLPVAMMPIFHFRYLGKVVSPPVDTP